MTSHEKPMVLSRTVWSNLVGLTCLVLSLLGVETGTIDQGAMAEALLQAAAGLAFVASTFFRLIATDRLTIAPPRS